MKSAGSTGRFACALLAFCLPLFAQSTNNDVISTTTEIVTVPVIVTDSSGKPVRGLKKEDFQLRDNGKEQRISSFEEVTATRVTLRGSSEQNGIYTNRLNNDNPVALGILVMDFVNTQTISQAWALRAAVSFLDKWKGEGGFRQPMMVAAITSGGLRIIHQATSDPEVLEGALLMLKSRPAPAADNNQRIEPVSNPARGPDNSPIVVRRRGIESDAEFATRLQRTQREAELFDQMERSNEVAHGAAVDADTRTTLWAMMAIANGVAGIPGRKALIWCAQTFPFKTVQEIFQSPQWVAKHGGSDEDAELQPLREGTLLAFNRANIAVYPVDTDGLLSPEYFNPSALGRPQTVVAQSSTKFLRTGYTDADNRAYARILAERTSGKACISNNDLSACINNALDDASHYYMLAYYPDPKPNGNGYRKIKVDVKGEKLEIRARNSYWHGTSPSSNSAAKSDVAVALGASLDYTALPLVLKFTGSKPSPSGKRIAQFVVGVDGRALTIDEDHGNHISLLIGASATVGDSPTMLSIDTKLKPEFVPQIRAKQLTHNAEMELAPGKYEIRLVVRDNLNGRLGSIVAPIEVQ